jgi:Ser/Thr protein kinase RdoA (MazF antagonist)
VAGCHSSKMKSMSSRGEQVLGGGNVAAAVVRVAAAVRKPSTQATPAVEALLEHLAALGFTGAPRTLGRDDHGRHILEFVPGQMADTLPSLSLAELLRLGRLIRELHDALARFRPPASARWQVAIPPDHDELVCHDDLAPWNLVRDGDRWVFIDWDGAGPGSRLWDLGYAAQSFVPLQAGGNAPLDSPRLRALADGYGLDEYQRRAFPSAIADHTRGMYELLHTSSGTGKQPWARLYAEGHGEHWRRAAEYVEAHCEHWTAALLD